MIDAEDDVVWLCHAMWKDVVMGLLGRD